MNDGNSSISSTPPRRKHSRRNPSVDSNASSRSNASPGSHVRRMFGKLGKSGKQLQPNSNNNNPIRQPKLSDDNSVSSVSIGSTASSGILPKVKRDADSAFLRNLRGDSVVTMAASPPRDNSVSSYSDADSAFLRAMRGDNAGGGGVGASQASSNENRILEKNASFDDSSSKGGTSLSDADSAFLQAFRGEDKLPLPPQAANVHKEEPKQQQQQQLPMELPTLDENNFLPVDEMAHANAAFLGALHASSDTHEDNPKPGGTLVLQTKKQPKHMRQDSSSHRSESVGASVGSEQSEANNAFLMAMRNSSMGMSRQQSSMSVGGMSRQQSYMSGGGDRKHHRGQLSSLGGTGEDWTNQEGWNNNNYNNSGTFILDKSAKKDKKQEDQQSFLMSIQAENAPEDEIVDKDIMDDSDSEEEDVDIEGLVVPSQPYIEKVMLPRPLFFGHKLPPRIIEEAEQAAKMYANDSDTMNRSWLEKEDAAVMEPKVAISDETSESAKTKSTVSTFSSTVGGDKLFQSNLLPCARNFEGAIETFGFDGYNPFHPDWNNEQNEDNTESYLPKGPHPYLTIYSPVWGDRARADRALSQRKKDKLAETSTMEKAQIGMPMCDASFRSYDSLKQISCGGSDDGSVEFSGTKDNHKAAAEDANNAFLSQLKSAPDNSDNSAISRDQFSMMARGESPSVEIPPAGPDNSNDLSSRDQFCMFARGDDPGGTFIGGLGSPIIATKGGTFVSNKPKNAFACNSGDSDDDSIEAAEERKAVGLNDNMAAAAAMLAGKEVDIDGEEDADGIGTPMCDIAAGGGIKAANKHGRPYSNLELTGGCVPRFSADDPSLPHESDLGGFETKEDERRTIEYRREKNIIQDMTVPSIMPLVVCPSQCTDVDDSQTWNSRASTNETGCNRKANTVLISLGGSKDSGTNEGSSACSRSTTYEASRIGFWNLPDGFDEMSGQSINGSKKRNRDESPLIEVFPAKDNPIPLDVITNLWPSPQVLCDNNISAAQLHSATSSARFMPHLSDRSPNLRHLQIDTTAVGFPKLGGEVEPMFCKLAIYHFEVNSPSSSHDKDTGESGSMSSSGLSSDNSSSSDRCGPVTEVLNFDVVQDPLVIQNCKKALWPYASKSDLEKLPAAIGSQSIDENVILEGSPCGIFPLPSHLHISNLYAVLLVHKVVSDDADQQPYFKPSRRDRTANSNQKEEFDLAKLRENASRSAESYGQLITPIAFGVLPLMQIVGNEESPKVPVTRVVQIPLFKYEQGRGADIILDHILGMLHPRAVPKIGKIAHLSRGHAFLVMRYYGFLGLHSIVSKIKMARKRLVDSSRELQVKREGDVKRKETAKCPNICDPYVVSPWRQQYVVEPTLFGGRQISSLTRVQTPDVSNENSTGGYAQELAAIPLEKNIYETKSSRRSSKSSTSNKFDNMTMHTSFCNELICHPHILTRCPKKNIVVKVELKQFQWIESMKLYAAQPTMPSIHNPRRGPWLVGEAFTSCAIKSANPRFLDEFKIKLPLILSNSEGGMGLFFSVYQVHIQKRKRESIIRPISRQINNSGVDIDDALELIGNGLLPLSTDESPFCLLTNGEHDVPINCQIVGLASRRRHQPKNSTSSLGSVVKNLKSSMSWNNDNDDVVLSASVETFSTDEEDLHAPQEPNFESIKCSYPEGTVFLERIYGFNESSDYNIPDHLSVKSDQHSVKSEQPSTKSDMGFNIQSSQPKGMTRSSLSSGDLQQLGSENPNVQLNDDAKQDASIREELLLKVNIVAFSSVHPQNTTVADFFVHKPDRPRCVTVGDFSGLSAWGKHRSEILYRLKPERIPPFNFVGGALAETERKLLDPTVNLSKTSRCPSNDLIPHLIRIISQLLRTMTSGIGEPSILWASPDALIPLRLNAFSSLLHVVSSASHYMTKTGLRLLDGDSKWNVTALSKTLALLFDEHKLFGGPLEDFVKNDSTDASQNKSSPKGSPRLLSKKPLTIARSKTSTERGVTPRPMIIERFSSEETKPQLFDVDAMLQSSKSSDAVDSIDQPVSTGDVDSRVDAQAKGGVQPWARNDFMSAMRAAANDDTESGVSNNLINSISSMPAGGTLPNRKRFFTLPAMATIQESDDNEENRAGGIEHPDPKPLEKKDSLDPSLIVHGDRAKPKQFRVPEVTKVSDIGTSLDGISSFLDSLSQDTNKQAADTTSIDTTTISSKSMNQNTVPLDDASIETAGTAFLDKMTENMGFLSTGKHLGGEERRVGAAHHRKTRSRCSIDWTLPPTDTLIEKDQKVEQNNRTKAAASSAPTVGFSPISSTFHDDASSGDDTLGYDSDGSMSSSSKIHPLKKRSKEKWKMNGSLLNEPKVLPDFADRMNAMQSDDGKKYRWWPYVYEVIIYQWLTLLIEQTRKGDHSNHDVQNSDPSRSNLSPIVTKYLSHAAKAARGATIRCAPYLLEIIKQSISWRIVMYRKRNINNHPIGDSNQENVLQLVKLDANILAALEKLITLLTDASIDSRNFDSFEFRKISIDVNDAVVTFIRDLFAMLDVQSVHRLVMVYFSRFVIKQGKHWHNRDSKTTGLRCSWETTKLRLNAITLFIRFSDFMKVNMPLMEMDDWESRTAGKSIGTTRRFYTSVLEKMLQLGLGELTSSEGPVRKEPLSIPRWTPHWLAELSIDILLGATGHAEESIQQRASSLLFELFWTISQNGRAGGKVSIFASVFVPFIPKVLAHVEYLSSLPAKSQLRKDIMPCVLFVLQSAPVGVMRALWRKLAKEAEGKAQQNVEKYGGLMNDQGAGPADSRGDNSMQDDLSPDIYDMLGLLNLSLSTIEYDGCESNLECDDSAVWRKEFLLSVDLGREQVITAMDPRIFSTKNASDNAEQNTTHNLRRWHAHDCSMIAIHTCRQIVRETIFMLKPSVDAESDFDESDPTSLDFQPGSLSYDELLLLSKSQSTSLDNVDSTRVLGSMDGDKQATKKNHRPRRRETLSFGVFDNVIFVRAATSVYLHALTMRQSDVAVVKTFTAVIEIVKIFGIKVFLNAVGETLQHWIRVILEHCGSRRAEVRVDACEFLNLLLRLTWDSYGSFFRIRLPLLAVQTEVMERIVSKATSKFEKEQKSLNLQPIKFSTENAEATLTPLWRTIDRIHHQSASLNLSFKSALARLAVMMKKLFKAYLAVHALNTLSHQPEQAADCGTQNETNPFLQRIRVSVHRIVSSASAAGHSRQIVGNQGSANFDLTSIQAETVEDSLSTAAYVFSSSELPSHRYAFLEKLAEFHRMRGRYAEEATCRLLIYHTYREAARQHAHVWCSSAFLPWATQSQVHQLDEGDDIDYENLSVTSAKYLDSNSPFRKIFYRAVVSVMVRTGDWGGFGGRFLFYGVTLKSEFCSNSPWFTLRQMEETMAEEAELAGDLFLKSGIVESSRHAWNIATHIYSETFNYNRLARAYGRLAQVVASQIPLVDTSNAFDMTSRIGRFYKVFFHGGAPDDLLHAQGTEGFVYRVPVACSIKKFTAQIETSIRSILPAKSVIDIVLDDGSPVVPKTGGNRVSALGGVVGESVKIKVTPLRPLFKIDDGEKHFRGTPEWFQMKTDEYNEVIGSEIITRSTIMHQRKISISSAGGNTMDISGSMSMSNRRSSSLANFGNIKYKSKFSKQFDPDESSSETMGADRFYFTQPAKRDPVRGFRDWLKMPTGSFAERSLRVTELQVGKNFPACVTRQKIIHRAIFSQSPLEASVEAVSTWCSLLFRTVMSANGLRVLKDFGGHEDGYNIIHVAKVLADCIHSSGVKQIGLSFLSVSPQSEQSTDNEFGNYSPYERLTDEECEKVQTKLARIIVTFLELLHLLIARNRCVILAAVQARKRRCADGGASVVSGTASHGISPVKGEDCQENDTASQHSARYASDMVGKSITTSKSISHKVNGSDRTDAAIAIQSELQRGFISLVRALSPNILDTINTEVPRWMRLCCQENYFSSGQYRQADIRIGEDLFFSMEEGNQKDDASVPYSINRGQSRTPSSPGNSLSGVDDQSETRSRHQFSYSLGSTRGRF